MSKKKIRDSVKIPSLTLEFEDKRINTFLHELIKSGNYKQAFELIMTKSFHNLEFFLDGTIPTDVKIKDTHFNDSGLEYATMVSKDVEDKFKFLTEAISSLNENQQTSKSSIDHLIKVIEDTTTKNTQLISTITQMQELMKETKEGLSTLDKLQTSGLNINKIIEDNTPLPEAPVPVREAPKPTREPVAKETSGVGSLVGVEREKAEASSIISNGIFNLGNSDGEGGQPAFDLESMMAKLKGGN